MDVANGVSTYDMVLIRLHILGVEDLTSPYQLIAADANNSGSISTLDLLEIQMVILNMLDEYPNNSSWRFIDRAYEFPNPADPWEDDFPEYVLVQDIQQEIYDVDFIGVKIGDVNGSAN